MAFKQNGYYENVSPNVHISSINDLGRKLKDSAFSLELFIVYCALLCVKQFPLHLIPVVYFMSKVGLLYTFTMSCPI